MLLILVNYLGFLLGRYPSKYLYLIVEVVQRVGLYKLVVDCVDIVPMGIVTEPVDPLN